MLMLAGALGLGNAHVVSVCGAGGKTTLLFALAREFVAGGERVLLTTTTKFGKDEATGPWPIFAANSADEILLAARRELQEAMMGGAVIAFSGETAARDRLVGFPPVLIDELKSRRYFDRILVEADGSARKPLKAPASHEPVIPATTDALIMVAGLSGLGLPLDAAHVFRPEIWSKLTATALGALVSAESLAQVVVHPEGLSRGCPEGAKKVLFLNQADNPDRLAEAKRVVQAVAAASERKPHRIVTGILLPEPRVIDLIVE
jgi:probable selenium-dependent hydroxylase accessory protein YqeC